MTLSTTTTRVQYDGNGSTKAFSVPYKFLSDSDLVVVLTSAAGVDTTQTITTHYTVTNSGNGGTVTMVTAPASGETLTISRVVSLTQETDYIEGDDFPAETHEAALDKLTMIAQQHDDTLNRAITVPRTVATTFDGELTPTASKIIGFNSAADAFQLFTPQDAGINDAANVAYTAGYTGTSTRTVQTKLDNDWFNILDFGGVGDGATDNTPAITAAFAAISTNGGGTLYFPAGTYEWTGVTPNTPNNCRITGDGDATILRKYISAPEIGDCAGLIYGRDPVNIQGYYTDAPTIWVAGHSRESSDTGISRTDCTTVGSGTALSTYFIDIEAANYGDYQITCETAGEFDGVSAGDWLILTEGRGTSGGGNSFISGRFQAVEVKSRVGDTLTLTAPLLIDFDGRTFPSGTTVPTDANAWNTYKIYAFRVTWAENIKYDNLKIQVEHQTPSGSFYTGYVQAGFARNVTFENVTFEHVNDGYTGTNVNDIDIEIGDCWNFWFNTCRFPRGILTSFNRSWGGGMVNCDGPSIHASPMEQGEGQIGTMYVNNNLYARAYSTTGGFGLYLSGVRGIHFVNNRVHGDWQHEDQSFASAPGAAVYLADCVDSVVSGNVFHGYSRAISVDNSTDRNDWPDYNVLRTTITGNVFKCDPNYVDGAAVSCALEGGVYHPYMENCVISGNVFEDYTYRTLNLLYTTPLYNNYIGGNSFSNPNRAASTSDRYLQGAQGGFLGRYNVVDLDVITTADGAKHTLTAGTGYTYRWTMAANKPLMYLCLGTGTIGTLNSGSTTGGISTGTAVLTVNSATNLYLGCRIDIAGVTSPTGGFEVIGIDGTTITLSANADATVAGAAVSYHAPTLVTVPTACDHLADLNQTISGTYTQSEVQAISDKVDALLALMRASGVMDAS